MEQTRYIEALCQIETGIVHNGQLYLPFADLVAMVQGMPQPKQGQVSHTEMDKVEQSLLKFQINGLKESHRFIREELSRALDLLDECLDLHSDPADSDLHTRIRKFLEPQP